MPQPTTTLDGRWQLVRAEMDGDLAPELVVLKTELELASGGYRVRFAGAVTDAGTFEPGESAVANASGLVFRGHEGPNAGRVIPCIYQRVGERLRICYGLDGVAPTEFTARGGQHRYLATYRRVGKHGRMTDY